MRGMMSPLSSAALWRRDLLRSISYEQANDDWDPLSPRDVSEAEALWAAGVLRDFIGAEPDDMWEPSLADAINLSLRVALWAEANPFIPTRSMAAVADLAEAVIEVSEAERPGGVFAGIAQELAAFIA